MSDQDEERRFERRLRHPPEKVWRALTEENELDAWFPKDDDVDAKREIVESDPPRLLVMRFGDEELRWEIAPASDGSVLILTTRIATALPANTNAADVTRAAA